MAEHLYFSPWHVPFLAFVAGLALLLVVARRIAFLPSFVMLFAFEIMADALLTGELKLANDRAWFMPVVITFVILGDWRYFVLIERYSRGGERAPVPALPVLGMALLFSLAVPIGQRVLGPVVAAVAAASIAPGVAGDSRWTFLTYEALFAVLAIVLRVAVLPARLRTVSAPVRAWLLEITTFEIVQYVLWALADVLILSAGEAGALRDPGFALRIVPNLMYYACFLPFVWFRAPAQVRDPSPEENLMQQPHEAVSCGSVMGAPHGVSGVSGVIGVSGVSTGGTESTGSSSDSASVSTRSTVGDGARGEVRG